MAGGLIYAPQMTPDGLSRPIDPGASGGELTGQAIGRLGQAVERAGEQVFTAVERARTIRATTDVERRTTGFLTDIDGLNQKYQNDPDPSTAPDRYREELDQARKTRMDGVDPMMRDHLDTVLARKAITAAANARFDHLKRQGDEYTGNLDKQFQVLTNQYANARTDGERAAAVADLETTLARGVSSGMATHKMAEGYRQALSKTGDEARALRAIGTSPAMARSLLADPAQLTGLDPVRRQQLSEQARSAEEEARAAGIVQQARFNPAAAALSAGRLTSPQQAELIFDRALIQQESGGRPGVVSIQGALGLSQIMPDTAREMARKLGRSDIAALDNAALKDRLTTDARLNRDLGLAYFNENLKKFNGSLAATFAAYHAGGGDGGAVDIAHRKAVAAHGEGYSPEQFLAFMPQGLKDGSGKRTVDYVRDLYGRMGVKTDQPALSTMASYRLTTQVGAELDRQRAETDKVHSTLVSLSKTDADQFSGVLKDGYTVDAARLAAVRAPLMIAAQRGDAAAFEKLRTLDEAVVAAPIVQQMYRMRPEELAAETARMRQEMAASPAVTPEMNRRVQLAERVLAEMQTARKDNPLALVERQGIVPASALNVQADLGNEGQRAGFATQVAARSHASDQAERYTGSRTFFRPEEREPMRQRYEQMGSDGRFDLLKAIAENASPRAYRAAVTEIAGSDKLSATAGMFMQTNPGLARDIIRGAEIAQMDGVKAKAEDVKTALRATLPGLMYPPEIQAQLVDAALATYAAERGKNATLYDASDKAGIEAAVERVVGRIAKINGGKVPLPADVSTVEMDQLFGLTGALPDSSLEAFGGAYDASGQKFDIGFIRRHARLKPMSVGGADFQVVIGADERPVQTKTNGPLVVNLRELVKSARIVTGDLGRMAEIAAPLQYLPPAVAAEVTGQGQPAQPWEAWGTR